MISGSFEHQLHSNDSFRTSAFWDLWGSQVIDLSPKRTAPNSEMATYTLVLLIDSKIVKLQAGDNFNIAKKGESLREKHVSGD